MLSLLIGCLCIVNGGGTFSAVLFIATSTTLSLSSFPLLRQVPRDKTVTTPFMKGIEFPTRHKKAFLRMAWTILYLNGRIVQVVLPTMCTYLQFAMPLIVWNASRIAKISAPTRITDVILLTDYVLSTWCSDAVSSQYAQIVTLRFILVVAIFAIIATFLFTLSFRNIVSLRCAYWTSVAGSVAIVMHILIGWILYYHALTRRARRSSDLLNN